MRKIYKSCEKNTKKELTSLKNYLESRDENK